MRSGRPRRRRAQLVFPGNRHTTFADLDYETAYGYIDAGLAAIEDAVRVRPTGIFVPFMDASPGTLRAAAELGIEWLYDSPDGDVPANLDVFLPVMPADSIRLQRGEEPATVMADFETAAAVGERFLFHPHYLEYFDAMDLFADWWRQCSRSRWPSSANRAAWGSSSTRSSRWAFTDGPRVGFMAGSAVGRASHDRQPAPGLRRRGPPRAPRHRRGRDRGH